MLNYLVNQRRSDRCSSRVQSDLLDFVTQAILYPLIRSRLNDGPDQLSVGFTELGLIDNETLSSQARFGLINFERDVIMGKAMVSARD